MTFSEIFATEIQQFRRLSKDTRGLCSRKNVHALRILTRKLRAALWIVREGYQVPAPADLQKRLRDLGKTLGKNRQIDVLFSDAHRQGFSTRKLKKSARQCRQALKKELSLDFRKSLVRDLRTLQRVLKKDPSKPAVLLAQMQAPLRKWPDQLPKNKRELHRIRIQTKKMIYRLEQLQQDHTELRNLQKYLGRIHDLEVLEKQFGNKARIQKGIEKYLARAQASYRASLSRKKAPTQHE